MNIRHHNGFGHGLRPGTDYDINCLSCQQERAQGIPPVITVNGKVPAAGCVQGSCCHQRNPIDKR